VISEGFKFMVNLPGGQKVLILRCLAGAQHPLTPREILDRDDKISDVGVYVALARMSKDGWLTATKDKDTAGQRGSPHRRYSINALGQRVLKLADEAEVALAGKTAFS
jgi:DNA-binding PadR family transcriptional regulator